MARTEADMIQSGWSVWSSDGKELGTVVGVDATAIHVKTGGLMGHELTVSKDDVDEVETGRVEVGLTKAEIDSAPS